MGVAHPYPLGETEPRAVKPEVLVVFTPGGQLNYNIWARVRDLLGGDPSRVAAVNNTMTREEALSMKPKGVIIGGGPYSVARDLDSNKRLGNIGSLARLPLDGVALMGICLGHQAVAVSLGGSVGRGASGEYSATLIRVRDGGLLFRGIPGEFTAWCSHFDEVKRMPEGLAAVAESDSCRVEGMRGLSIPVYTVQFHPEVEETQHGLRILYNFLRHICGLEGAQSPKRRFRRAFSLLLEAYKRKEPRRARVRTRRRLLPRVLPVKGRAAGRRVTAYRLLFPPSPILRPRGFVKAAVSYVRGAAPDGRVLLALSGGIDSSVCAGLMGRTLGDRLWAIHVDHGFMRSGESRSVVAAFEDRVRNLIYVDASRAFIEAVRGLGDAEEKRRAFSETYFRLLAQLAREVGAPYVAQGTIWPDIAESTRRDRRASGSMAFIKSQHNVNPPEEFTSSPHLRGLIEPVAGLFKHEERPLASHLGLPPSTVFRMPFPGPGLMVRVAGEVSEEALGMVRRANRVVEEEVRREILERFGVPIFIDEDGYHIPWQALAFLARRRRIDNGRTEAIGDRAEGVLQEHGVKVVDCYLLGARMTGVKGDERSYTHPAVLRLRAEGGEELITHEQCAELFLALTGDPRLGLSRVLLDISSEERAGPYLVGMRAVESAHAMTARNMRLRHETIIRIRDRLERMPGVAGVLYDIGNKPSATIEPE